MVITPFSANDTLVSLIEHACRRFATRTAFINMNTTLTFQQLDDKASAFAGYLKQHEHLKRGDRVAIMMPNLLQYPIVLYGVLKAGMVATTINPLYTADELAHQLRDSGAKAIVLVSFAAPLLHGILSQTNIRTVITTHLGDCLSKPLGWLVNALVFLKKPHRIPKALRHVSLRQTLRHKPLSKPASIKPDDIALLQYTGGTTGAAKAAVLHHKHLVANIDQCKHALANAENIHKPDTVLTALPLYHIFSMVVNCLLFITLGGTNVLITDPRNIRALNQTLQRYPFTVMTGVNTLFNALAHHQDLSRTSFRNIRAVVGGGMAVQPKTARLWHKKTGTLIMQGYGLTETSPVVSVNPLSLKQFNGSVGKPLIHTQIAIRKNNKPVKTNEHGEVCIKGPQVMAGYWQQQQETKDVIDRQGWLHTGDVGYQDKDGYIYLVERMKNVVIVSGFNVYPSEVEHVLCEHPDVLEAACIGVPHAHSGQAVKAFVVLRKPKAVSADALIGFCHEHLAPYKVPRHIVFRRTLPKSTIGKVLHRKL